LWVEIKQKHHTQAKQNKESNSFTTFHRQAGVQPSPGKQGFVTHNGYLGRQTPSLQMSLPSSSPQLYIMSVMSYGMEHHFGQLGSAVPAVSSPKFSCIPSLLAGGVE